MKIIGVFFIIIVISIVISQKLKLKIEMAIPITCMEWLFWYILICVEKIYID